MDTMIAQMQIPVHEKRVVFIQTDGPLAGMHRIVSAIPGGDVSRLNTFVPDVEWLDGHHSGASLIRVTDRAVYFRELILPTSVKTREVNDGGTPFHPSPAQR